MKPFTMIEAASELGISRTKLQQLVDRHPFYYANGNRKLFTVGDIEALRAAMRREGEICRNSRLDRLKAKKGRIGPSAIRSREETLKRALELATTGKRRNSSKTSSATIVPLRPNKQN
jgi:hypothetical protein